MPQNSKPTRARKATAPRSTPTGGRPRKLEIDPDLKTRIVAMVRAGAYPERAAVAAGVSERSHYGWQAKGLEERAHRDAGGKPRVTMQVFLDYVDDIDRAVAEAEIMLMGKVVQGGAGASDLRWVLERRFRDRWAAGPPATAPAAAAPAAPAATVTPLVAVKTQRERRNVKAT